MAAAQKASSGSPQAPSFFRDDVWKFFGEEQLGFFHVSDAFGFRQRMIQPFSPLSAEYLITRAPQDAHRNLGSPQLLLNRRQRVGCERHAIILTLFASQ